MEPRHESLYKRDVKIYLKGLPPEICSVFALRMALRALPLLAGSGSQPFWYWKPQEIEKNLLSILRGLLVGMTCSLSTKEASDIDVHYAALAASTDSSTSIYTRIAIYASKITDPQFGTHYGPAAYLAWDTSAYAFYASGEAMVAVYENVIIKDLDILISAYYKTDFDLDYAIDPVDFLQRPLWFSGRFPSLLYPVWEDFFSWFKSIGFDCGISLDWYLNCIQGKEINIEQLKEQLNNINAKPWREDLDRFHVC